MLAQLPGFAQVLKMFAHRLPPPSPSPEKAPPAPFLVVMDEYGYYANNGYVELANTMMREQRQRAQVAAEREALTHALAEVCDEAMDGPRRHRPRL